MCPGYRWRSWRVHQTTGATGLWGSPEAQFLPWQFPVVTLELSPEQPQVPGQRDILPVKGQGDITHGYRASPA